MIFSFQIHIEFIITNLIDYRMTKLFAAVAGLALFTACSSSSIEEPADNIVENDDGVEFALKERKDIALSSRQKDVLRKQNDFSFKLFKSEISTSSKVNTNPVVSPLSVSICLSMVANGASEEVKEEIIENLLSADYSLQDLNSLNQTLYKELKDADNSAKLKLDNSIWVNLDHSLQPAFQSAVKDYFNASAAATDMYDESSAALINKWLNEATEGLIPTIYDGAPKAELAIINALYFKGAWTIPFDEKNTSEDLFLNADGTKSKSLFMNSLPQLYASAISSEYSVVSLPYGNEAFSLYALRANDNSSFDDLITSLDAGKWNDIKKDMKISDIIVRMPKFSVEAANDDMKPLLNSCGITKLFVKQDALSNSITPPLLSGKVEMKSKTVFSIDEKGAEGASYTSAELILTSNGTGGESIETISFDMPFIYIIEEKSTGAILFMGAINHLD